MDLGGDVLGQAEGQALVQDLGDGEGAVRAVHPDAVPGEDLAVEARPPVDVVVELVAAPEARRVRGEEERARVVVGRVVGVPVDGPQVHRDVELVVRQRRQRVQRGLDRGAVGAPVEAGRREAAVPQAEVRAGQRAPVQGQRDLLPLGHAALDDRLDADVEAREVRPGPADLRCDPAKRVCDVQPVQRDEWSCLSCGAGRGSATGAIRGASPRQGPGEIDQSQMDIRDA